MDAIDYVDFPSCVCPIGQEMLIHNHALRNSIEGLVHHFRRRSRVPFLDGIKKCPGPWTRAFRGKPALNAGALVRVPLTDAAVQIVRAAQTDASRMRGEAEKEVEVASFLKASLSSLEQQRLCARSARQAAAIIKAARDQAEETEKLCRKAVANARLRHRKKAVASSGGVGGSAAAMPLSAVAPAPAASSTGSSFTCTPASTPHSGVGFPSSKGLDTTNMCTATADPDRPLPDRPGWPTFQQKKKLYDLCTRLTLAELNQMVSLVQRGCQVAVQECGRKEVEVDVDELDMETFQNVLRWAKSKTKFRVQRRRHADNNVFDSDELVADGGAHVDDGTIAQRLSRHPPPPPTSGVTPFAIVPASAR